MTVHASQLSRDAEVVRREALRLSVPDDYERIISWVGDASVVLLGESTHGTDEFYEARALITRLLIEKRGFTGVAIEGDWPDAYRVNRYINTAESVGDPADALGGFERFPTWMWRNSVVVDLISWLRARNAAAEPRHRTGFYGLDLYSLRSSMKAVIDYLDKHDPAAARSARQSYGCFDQFGRDAEAYSRAASRSGGKRLCEEAVTRELLALREHRAAFLRHNSAAASDEFFYAEQNARLARNAEHYYRTLFKGRVASWNIRDRHMADTLEALLAHLGSRGQAPKIVVWAHNSHLGDARATEMGDDGEINLGQRVRTRHGADSRIIGFTTHHGTVIAATDWGEPAERKTVRPALAGSCEALFHETDVDHFFLPLTPGSGAYDILATPLLQRAIGVVYRPDTERQSHYFRARLSHQFDAVVHFDSTQALQPLERKQPAFGKEVPETFPSGV